MSAVFSMLVTALYTMLVQNIVFSTGYGISESIRMAKRPKHLFMYFCSITIFSLTSGTVCFFLRRIPFVAALELKYVFIVNALALAGIYFIVSVICLTVFSADKKFMNSLGMCTFNTLVLALPVLTFKAGYTFSQVIGTSLGAGAAFIIAALLINKGMQFISKSPYIPEIFKGTPALVIYVSLIALAMSCISGQSLFV